MFNTFDPCVLWYTLVKIFQGSLRILKDLHEDLCEGLNKDLHRQGSLRRSSRILHFLAKILMQGSSQDLGKILEDPQLKILKDFSRILEEPYSATTRTGPLGTKLTNHKVN